MSQVKVHGSTMLESFQHEWQQSSAEVREVQDFMKKKDPKPSGVAAAVGGGGDDTAANGGVAAPGGGAGAGAGAHVSNDVYNGAHPAPGSAPQSSGAGTAPSVDGTVEHRPHAASAATVTPSSKRAAGGGVGGGAASGTGVGTATVEDIVRGVPAEMVVPAPTTTCVGPTGADGLCRGEVLVDKVAAGGGVAGAAASLGSEIPTMGAAGAPAPGNLADSAMVGGADEGSGAGPERVGVDIGEDSTGVSTDNLGRPVGGGEGEGATGTGAAPSASGRNDPPSREENSNQLEGGGAIDGSAAAEAEADTDAAAKVPVDAGDGGFLEDVGVVTGEGSGAHAEGEEGSQPPRKGIIHSTMEAISKAVHRGEGSKPKDNGAAAESGPASESVDDGGGDSTASSDASVDGAVAMVDDGDVGPRSSEAPGSASTSAGIGGEADGGSARQGEVGTPAGDSAGVPDAEAMDAAPGAPAGGEPPATGKSDSRNTATTAVEGQESSDAAPGRGASEGGVVPSAQNVGEEAHEPSGGVGDHSGTAGLTGETPTGRPPAGEGGASGSDAEAKKLESEHVDPPDARSGGGSGVQQTEGAVAVEPAAGEGDGDQHQRTDSTAATVAEGVGAGEGAAGADHPLPATRMSHATQAESSRPQQGSGGLPSTTQPHGGSVSAAVLQHGQPQNAEPSLPVLLVEETNAATLTAACLNTLTFSEFRDEVLARTQQAQQSAGGGVAIGGQYESIFKTLMNKIKTLEINQSLYSLYIGTS